MYKLRVRVLKFKFYKKEVYGHIFFPIIPPYSVWNITPKPKQGLVLNKIHYLYSLYIYIYVKYYVVLMRRNFVFKEHLRLFICHYLKSSIILSKSQLEINVT